MTVLLDFLHQLRSSSQQNSPATWNLALNPHPLLLRYLARGLAHALPSF